MSEIIEKIKGLNEDLMGLDQRLFENRHKKRYVTETSSNMDTQVQNICIYIAESSPLLLRAHQIVATVSKIPRVRINPHGQLETLGDSTAILIH